MEQAKQTHLGVSNVCSQSLSADGQLYTGVRNPFPHVSASKSYCIMNHYSIDNDICPEVQP